MSTSYGCLAAAAPGRGRDPGGGVTKAALYDTIGRHYSRTRQADPRIQRRLERALGGARTVVNVGAGAGAYEPEDCRVVAIEPSAVMISQRPPGAVPAVLARAEDLPLIDGGADAAMAVLTVHHWADPERGLAELCRVARRRALVLTLDPIVAGRMWLYEYAPEIAARFSRDFPPIARLQKWMGGASTEVIPIPSRCRDCFLEAFWDRPELVFDPVVRAGTSGFARLDPQTAERIVSAVREDLASGEWDRRHGHLRTRSEYDGGLRLLKVEL